MIIGRLFVIAGCLRASVMYPVLLVLDEVASTKLRSVIAIME
jgi:hypothetical protein